VKRNQIVTNVYDTKGYVSQINNGSSILWKMNSSDSRGRPVSYNLGDPGLGLNVQFTYDPQGRLATKTTVQMKQTYVFDPNSGNLSSRDYRTAGSQTGLYESFGYDTFNRLTSSTIGNNSASVTYSANGNINTKSNVGGYTYDPTKVNAVSNISVSGGAIDAAVQAITYNASNLTTQIKLGVTEYNIKYNPFDERIKTVNDIDAVTKFYSGSYEKKINGTTAKEYHYINSPYGLVAIIIKDQTVTNTYYVETDHLGSIIGLLNSNQTYAERLSYDAWGKRRNATDWTYQGFTTPTLTDRGFTGHEHLDCVGLINANGRMYDPVIGRFLGVDPIIADGNNSQSFNSYTYALNNPLRLIDRDGFQYEEAYTGGPVVASISTWSFDTWREMRRQAKEGYSYLDCVDIANGSQDADDVFIQRLLQLQYGAQGQGGENLSLAGMYLHFQVGGRKPMTINSASLDFSGTSQKQLGLAGMKLGESREGNLFRTGINAQSLAFGRLEFTYQGSNQFSITSNMFDFDYQAGQSFSRNAGTILGGAVNNNVFPSLLLRSPIPTLVPMIFGGPYNVIFNGNVTIPQ
jgi:RHS repeat-associated protein